MGNDFLLVMDSLKNGRSISVKATDDSIIVGEIISIKRHSQKIFTVEIKISEKTSVRKPIRIQ